MTYLTSKMTSAPSTPQRHTNNHPMILKKQKQKWGGVGGTPGGAPQGHITNQSIDPRGKNNPTPPLISKQ